MTKKVSAKTDDKKEQLINEVREVLASAEELYESAVDDGSSKAKELKKRLQERIADARVRLQDIEGEVVERAKEVAKQTDQLVQDNPYKFAGIAAAVGFLLGLLVSRR
ncbi:MAG: DUF883 domain-containing protein [Neisseriaceae bacterium]|nr:DUF883 domain-containing protein [Neisseriaceae bacterium]